MSQLVFRYKAIDAAGQALKGELRAATRNDAYRQLMTTGMRPVVLKAVSSARSHRRKKISYKDLAHFTYQLSVMLDAGVTIVDSLRSIAEQEPNPHMKVILEDVSAQIAAGNTVTEALSPHRALFGDIYVDTVHSAEQSGNMTEVLSHLANMMDRNYEMTKSVKGALIYPACVVGALSLAVVFLMVFVVPRFATMFESRGMELPLATQIIIAFSDIMIGYWYAILGGAGFGYWGLKGAWAHPEWRQRIDTWLHKVPYLKSILLGLAVSRFAHVFGVSLRSGVSLLEALEVSGRASGRPLLEQDARKMRDEVNQGGRLTDALSGCAYLPSFARRMISAGEEAGELPRMFDIVGKHYDREVQHLTKNVATAIEPIMIVGLAGVVMLIALAIFLPMWNMAALVG